MNIQFILFHPMGATILKARCRIYHWSALTPHGHFLIVFHYIIFCRIGLDDETQVYKSRSERPLPLW
jgi:hypothetical protein